MVINNVELKPSERFYTDHTYRALVMKKRAARLAARAAAEAEVKAHWTKIGQATVAAALAK